MYSWVPSGFSCVLTPSATREISKSHSFTSRGSVDARTRLSGWGRQETDYNTHWMASKLVCENLKNNKHNWVQCFIQAVVNLKNTILFIQTCVTREMCGRRCQCSPWCPGEPAVNREGVAEPQADARCTCARLLPSERCHCRWHETGHLHGTCEKCYCCRLCQNHTHMLKFIQVGKGIAGGSL